MLFCVAKRRCVAMRNRPKSIYLSRGVVSLCLSFSFPGLLDLSAAQRRLCHDIFRARFQPQVRGRLAVAGCLNFLPEDEGESGT